jgi:hypothetical protein
MAITYPVDVENTEWAVYQVSTGQIIARHQSWPRADGEEIVGLDPDYVYLLHVDDAEPDYDSRLFVLVGTETIDVPNNQLLLHWSTPARPLDEQILAAENREAQQLEAVIGRLAREAIETRLVVGAILNFALKNQTYPTKVNTLVEDYIAKALKVWQNRDVLALKIADLELGIVPDLDADWVE